MSQPLPKKANSSLNPIENVKHELKQFYVLGMPLLKLMFIIVVLGLLAIGLFEYCSGGTAG